ncbi:RNase P/MRP, p29 subunit [Lichtheimia hyalospora FSU 10163]|nr:RNase P/MRP, p29 subunit [Lichtheimia hyalospora FSU 10163]
MAQPRENLYLKLGGSSKSKLNAENAAIDLVKEYIPPSASAEQVVKDMKPFQMDASHIAMLSKEKSKQPKSSKKKTKPLSAKERRSLHIYDIPKEAIRYDLFEPLHQLWLGYMKELYDQGHDAQVFRQKLLKADYHGAIFEVIKSTNPSMVGLRGIVVQETQNLFNMITNTNQLKRIPKAGTVFSMELPMCNIRLTIYGQQLLVRSAERAAKKFKPKPTIDM